MTPVNLGDLPSNQPAPTGKVQMMRGLVGGGQRLWSDASYINNGSSVMQIVCTTGNLPGWWVLRAEMIYSIADAAWHYFNWYVGLSQNDANGVSVEYAYHRLHSALSWQHSVIDTAFKLDANQTYIANMFTGGRSGGTIYYWTGADYLCFTGEFIAEGSY